ncbi:hypothetical protein EDB92DRAFT_1945199 [Lactarius akahatsu]|uniref:F-box domain-containing protein n=1 Tax=Lactarius akahatsu TaxID=416441 RepID=A0AAD4LI21_9AGAM|nr:hypothetical protein EDB92DRAFT_1945199 [Lactarius akahatsu]
MPEPHVAIFSDTSPVLIDGELGVGHAREELSGNFSTIEGLPEEMVLEIFYFYKLACGSFSLEWQKEWQKLVHVCWQWRTIIFASQHRLALRLICTPKASIKQTLDLWPAFPIVARYSGGNLSPDDRDKITAVLQQHDRICEINLDLYHPLSEKESQIMQETFPLLECLVLCSWQGTDPVLSSTFLSGSVPRLRVLHLYGIAFPALPRLLSSASDLVDLLLHRVPSTGYISPEALVSGLNTPPPLSEQITISTLIQLTFDGPCNYLNDLLSRISAPSLKHAKIDLFDQPHFDISQLSQFLGRVESQRLPNVAQAILYLPGAFRYCTQSVAPAGSPPNTSECFNLNFAFPSRFELFQLNQICQQISSFLSGVRALDIHTFVRPLGSDEDFAQWLNLFHVFSRVEQLHITGRSSLNVAYALQLISAEIAADVLPTLRELTLDPFTSESREAVTSFVDAHKVAGLPAISFRQPMVIE